MLNVISTVVFVVFVPVTGFVIVGLTAPLLIVMLIAVEFAELPAGSLPSACMTKLPFLCAVRLTFVRVLFVVVPVLSREI